MVKRYSLGFCIKFGFVLQNVLNTCAIPCFCFVRHPTSKILLGTNATYNMNK